MLLLVCVSSKELGRNYEHQVRLNSASLFSLRCLLLLCIHHPVLQALHVVTAFMMVQQQSHFKVVGIPFVAATNGVLVRARLSVRICVPS